MKNEESMLIRSVELMQRCDVCYSGGALNSHDKMAEVAINSLGGAEGPCFMVCAVDRSLVPLCIHRIGNGKKEPSVFSMKDVLRFAVASSAYGLIIMRNGIFSGECFNEQDLEIVTYVQEKGLMIGIYLIDYIIMEQCGINRDLWFLSDNLTNFSKWNYERMNGAIK